MIISNFRILDILKYLWFSTLEAEYNSYGGGNRKLCCMREITNFNIAYNSFKVLSSPIHSLLSAGRIVSMCSKRK